MEIFHSGGVVPYESCAVALGEFDGLHTAHMKIISEAAGSGLAYGVMYFSQNPKHGTTKLISDTYKQKLLSGCDFLYIQDFTDDFQSKSCVDFAHFIKDVLHAGVVAAGYNYRFGAGAAGGIEELKRLGERYGFKVRAVTEQKLNGHTVSSSAIREYIKKGDMESAAMMLGRPYCMDGEVIHGRRNGHKMGFPTVNIDYDAQMTMPASGVYAGYTTIKGKKYASVINVGSNPTFNADRISVESHLIGFSSDAYGEYALAELAHRIRGERKFSSAEELARQIALDRRRALEMTGQV